MHGPNWYHGQFRCSGSTPDQFTLGSALTRTASKRHQPVARLLPSPSCRLARLRMRTIKERHSPIPDVSRPASKCHQQLQGSYLLHYPVLHVSCTFTDEGDQGVTFAEPRWFGCCTISTGCSGFCKFLSPRRPKNSLSVYGRFLKQSFFSAVTCD